MYQFNVVPCVFLLQDENSDLFYSVPWSYGTLGFLVAAELSIIPAKKYVKLEYTPLTDRATLSKLFPEASSSDEKYDFVETLVFAKDRGVLMKGKMTDKCEFNKVGVTVGRRVGYFASLQSPKILIVISLFTFPTVTLCANLTLRLI